MWVVVGEGFILTLKYFTYSIFNSSSTKSFNISPTNAITYYIGVYGFSSSSYFQITASNTYSNLTPGQIQSGVIGYKQRVNYTITIPENAADFSLIAQTSEGDPDQYVYNYNQINFPVWANYSIGIGFSCIYAKAPPPGTYLYSLILYKYIGASSTDYQTGFFLNYGNSCQFPNTEDESFNLLESN